MTRDIVIVGGGLAAQRCCEALRRNGWDGAIRMVCAETHPPYDRPPLSKEALAKPVAPASFRAGSWYADNGVELLLSTAATGLDHDAERIFLAGGETLGYERLLVATGAAPILPPLFTGYGNVHTVRDFRDALRLHGRLEPRVATRRVRCRLSGARDSRNRANARRHGNRRGYRAPPSRTRPSDRSREMVRRAPSQTRRGVRTRRRRPSGPCVKRPSRLHRAVSGRRISATNSWLRSACVRRPTGSEPPASRSPPTRAGTRHSRTCGPRAMPPPGQTARAASPAGRSSGRPPRAREQAPRERCWVGQPRRCRSRRSGRTSSASGPSRSARTSEPKRPNGTGTPDTDDFAVTWWRGDDAIGGLLADRPGDLPALRRLIEMSETTKGGEHELQGADR